MSTQIDGGGVHRRGVEEAVGPVDDELVRLREPFRGDEGGAGVADGDAVAEQLADPRERGRVVDRPEDVHRRARVERVDEDCVAVELREGAVDRRLDQALPTDPVACRRYRDRDRAVGVDRLGELWDQRRVERRDQDRHGAAAGEADLEGLVVGDPVLAQSRRAAVEHLLRLPDHRRLDAAAGDRARDLAGVVQRQRRAGITRRRAAPLDDRRDRHATSLGAPADERTEDLPHA